MPIAHSDQSETQEELLSRIWIYTNYDCNLSCSYCVAESYVGADRRGLDTVQVKRVIDEAIELGMSDLFLTGGEPFILHDIFAMIGYGLEHMQHVTVLSNGILLKGNRLTQLEALPHRERLTIQISLDGSRADIHDCYRGAGSWQKAIDAITRLQQAGFHVRLGTTHTPENGHDLSAMCELHRSLHIPDEDHIIRPLVRRGFSAKGMALSLPALEPEVTINRDGVYWHPVATDDDLMISPQIFPLVESVTQIRAIRQSMLAVTGGAASRFR